VEIPVKKASLRYQAVAFVAMWLLLQSGEEWSWVIIGGFESRDQCHQARAAHVLAPEHLLCARTGLAAEEPRHTDVVLDLESAATARVDGDGSRGAGRGAAGRGSTPR
jgi:hypothetical protein